MDNGDIMMSWYKAVLDSTIGFTNRWTTFLTGEPTADSTEVNSITCTLEGNKWTVRINDVLIARFFLKRGALLLVERLKDALKVQ